MTDSREIRTDVLFKVSEGPKGERWISLEPRKADPELAGVLIGFDLENGTTMARAEDVATFLNANLGDLVLTFVDGAAIRK